MAGKKATCKSCSKELNSDEKCKYKNKTYCRACYDNVYAEDELKKGQKIIKDDNGYKQLIEVICKYFNIQVPTPLILKQIKEFKNEFKYTYVGIHYSLWYVTNIENKVLDSKYGIALLKFYYEKSKQYYEQQQKITASVQNTEYIEPTVNLVKVNLNKVYEKKNKFLIDISEFFKEGKCD